MKRTILLISIAVLLFLSSCVSSEIKGARDGDLNAVREFVSQGGDVNERQRGDMTLLMYASAGGHVQIIDYLMTRGADLRIRDDRGYTALLHGAAAGRNNSLESLLGYGASLEDRDKQGRNALMTAASNDLYSTAAYLLERGINPAARDNSGWTALLIALDRSASLPGGFSEVYDLLTRWGASFSVTETPVRDIAFKAARGGNRDVLDLLFGMGLDRSIRDAAGNSLLHSGISHSAMADYLLSLGLDKNSLNHRSESPLLLAVRQEALESVLLLLREGAWTEQRDRDGKTPLLYAAEGTDLEVLRAMVLGGADIYATDRKGNTALHLAARGGTAEGVRLLLTAGIFVNAANREGKTPYDLSFANTREGEKIRPILVTAGAVIPETENTDTTTDKGDETDDTDENDVSGEPGQPAKIKVLPAPQDEPVLNSYTLSWPRINPSRAEGWSNRDKLTSRGKILLRYGEEGREEVSLDFTLPMQGVNGAEGSVDFEAEWNGSDPVTFVMVLETEQGKSLISEVPRGGENGSEPVLFEEFRYE